MSVFFNLLVNNPKDFNVASGSNHKLNIETYFEIAEMRVVILDSPRALLFRGICCGFHSVA